MIRRQFLSLPLAAQAQSRIPIALLGASHSHGLAKAQLLRDSPDFDLRGAWEPDPATAARLRQLQIQLLAQDAILSNPEILAVAVEGDVADQGKHALMALEAGKHVHVEKPGGPDHAVFTRIVSLALGRSLQLQTGYMWRYNPGFELAMEAARAGWLGEVYQMHGMMNTLIEAERRPDWARFPGGQMFEMGGYLIDAMTRLKGRPVRVTPFLRHDGSQADKLQDNTAAVLEFVGALGIVRSSTLQPNAGLHRCFEIYGTRGNAVLRPIEQPVLEVDLLEAAGPYQKGRQRVNLPSYQRYQADFAALAAAIRGQKALPVSPQQELLTHETLLRACGVIPD